MSVDEEERGGTILTPDVDSSTWIACITRDFRFAFSKWKPCWRKSCTEMSPKHQSHICHVFLEAILYAVVNLTNCIDNTPIKIAKKTQIFGAFNVVTNRTHYGSTVARASVASSFRDSLCSRRQAVVERTHFTRNVERFELWFIHPYTCRSCFETTSPRTDREAKR